MTRLAMSLRLGLVLGIAFTPLGCGGAQQQAAPPPSAAAPDPRVAPEEVVAKLTECVKRGAHRLTSTNYTVRFNVKADRDGQVSSVAVKDTILRDPEIETCMVNVLQGMTLPATIMAMRPAQPVAERAATPESRTLVGNPALIVGGV